MSATGLRTRTEANAWSIDDILRRAREGELFIPIFQRNYRWEKKDIRDLFDSVYKGYPIGDLLVWETSGKDAAKTIFGDLTFRPAEGKQNLIVDGQQRISSFVAVLLGSDKSDEKFQLYFDLDSGQFTYQSDKYSALPLHVVSDTVKFLQWLQTRKLTPDQVNKANEVLRSLRDYRLPVYIVRTSDESAIRDIFYRKNSAGKQLKLNEVFDALQRGRPSAGRDLRSLSDWTLKLQFGRIGEEWCLKAVATILQIDVTKNLGEALRNKEEPALQQAIADTEQALAKTVDFLRTNAEIPHIQLMPYRLPIVALTKLFHFIDRPSDESRAALTAWIWRGAQTGEHQRADSHSIRPVLRAITNNEAETIGWFRRSSPLPTVGFQVPEHSFSTAGTKLVCAALASLKPRHLVTGELVDMAALLDESGPKACLRISRYTDTADRILHPTLQGSARDAILAAPTAILATHLISEAAVAALRRDEPEGFLEIRKTELQAMVSEFLKDHTR